MLSRGVDGLRLPAPSGAYGVGFQRREVTSERVIDYKATSAALPLSLWYPACRESLDPAWTVQTIDVLEGLDCDCLVNMEFIEELASQQLRKVLTWSYIDCPPAPLSSLPVLVYSHGLGMSSTSGWTYCEELASHGFIVVGIDHTGYSSKNFDKQRVLSRPMMETRNNFQKDIEAVLQLVTSQLDGSDHILGMSNSSRIGLFGHSIGGGAAWQSLWQDTRIAAAVSMDGFLTNRVFKKIAGFEQKPLLIMFAERIDDDFFPVEFGPARPLLNEDLPSPLTELHCPCQCTFTAAANFPHVNVIDMAIGQCEHFSFTTRLCAQEFVHWDIEKEVPSCPHREECVGRESLSSRDSGEDDTAMSRTLSARQFLGIGSPTLQAIDFLSTTRLACLQFFAQTLTL